MYLFPIDASMAVSFLKNADGSYDLTRARVKRFGIGYGQKGFWGNTHYGTEQEAREAYENYLAGTRVTYGKGNGRDWTGNYEEEAIPVPIGGNLIEGRKFYPLKKNGKRGVRVHTVHLYRLTVSEEKVEAIKKALPHVTIVE